MASVFMVLFLLTGVLLMLLVLIQKGRGGGLAGAFGGPGGHSAFGTKTADVLTKLTAALGAVFFFLAILTGLFMRRSEPYEESASSEQQGPLSPGAASDTPRGGETGDAPNP